MCVWCGVCVCGVCGCGCVCVVVGWWMVALGWWVGGQRFVYAVRVVGVWLEGGGGWVSGGLRLWLWYVCVLCVCRF